MSDMDTDAPVDNTPAIRPNKPLMCETKMRKINVNGPLDAYANGMDLDNLTEMIRSCPAAVVNEVILTMINESNDPYVESKCIHIYFRLFGTVLPMSQIFEPMRFTSYDLVTDLIYIMLNSEECILKYYNLIHLLACTCETHYDMYSSDSDNHAKELYNKAANAILDSCDYSGGYGICEFSCIIMEKIMTTPIESFMAVIADSKSIGTRSMDELLQLRMENKVKATFRSAVIVYEIELLIRKLRSKTGDNIMDDLDPYSLTYTVNSL